MSNGDSVKKLFFVKGYAETFGLIEGDTSAKNEKRAKENLICRTMRKKGYVIANNRWRILAFVKTAKAVEVERSPKKILLPVSAKANSQTTNEPAQSSVRQLVLL